MAKQSQLDKQPHHLPGEARPLEVGDQMAQLEKSVDVLAGSFKDLYQRLTPVLHPSDPPASVGAEVPVVATPLAVGIQNINFRVNEISRLVNLALTALEI